MIFSKLTTAFVIAFVFIAGAAFADETSKIEPRKDANVVDQSITQAGGSVDLMYVMLEDPDVSALQDFCVGGCDVEFRIAYRITGVKAALLQAVSITPVRDSAAPKLFLKDKAFVFPVEAVNTAEFFSELRKQVRRESGVLFRAFRGS